mgnify:CR=1 FL=1
MSESLEKSHDPWLLTPGPLTTSKTVKEAMLHDFGSRDERFISINHHVRTRLVEIIDGKDSHVCVPLQGSGTFVVEARRFRAMRVSISQAQSAIRIWAARRELDIPWMNPMSLCPSSENAPPNLYTKLHPSYKRLQWQPHLTQ